MEALEAVRQDFAMRGIAKLEGAIPLADAHRARDMIVDLAREHGVFGETGWVRSPSRFGYPKPLRRAIGAAAMTDPFSSLLTSEIRSLAQDLVGEKLVVMAPGQQVLFTLPGEDAWVVPHDAWHVDLPKRGEAACPGLQLFTFLDDVEPRGGGTVVVAGSHRLANHCGALSSKQFKHAIGREDYFRALFDPSRRSSETAMEDGGVVDGVPVQVVELTGGPGDAWLMDLRVLHSPAPNMSDRARMMVTARLAKEEVAAKYGGS